MLCLVYELLADIRFTQAPFARHATALPSLDQYMGVLYFQQVQG